MIETTLYALGILLRICAFVFAVIIVWQHRSWGFVVIALGIFWISLQPFLQLFFSDNFYVSELPRPEIFIITSSAALFVIYHFHAILKDNRRYAQKENNELERSARRNSILHELAKQRKSDLETGLTTVAQSASKELGISRVSVWLFNEAQDEINSQISLSDGQVVREQETLNAKDFPDYFAALSADSAIMADNASQHPATREFASSYLEPNNILSLMDLPLRLDGEVIGIVCFEHTDEPKHWTNEDQDFGHSIADLCALVITADRRREILMRLEESERHLRNAQNAGQFGSFRWELANNEFLWSGATMEEIGFSSEREHTYEEFLSCMEDADADQYSRLLSRVINDHTSLRSRFKTRREFGSRHYEIRADYQDSASGGCFEGTIQNVTEQVLAAQETQHLEAQLIQSQKMESIGTLAGGIAHDFNNILTPILGYTDIALAKTPSDDPLHPMLEEVLHNSLRAKELIKQILVFGRRWDEKLELIDLESSITSALKLVRPTLPSSIHIDLSVTPGYKLIEADATQMIQVLVNLCTNAWHAMEQRGGTLSLRLYPSDDGKQAVLEVSDTGTGIDPEAIKRIFDPFYTTKEVGKGTGLGLAVVHGIITKLGAEISVSSEPDKFTTFKLAFPTTNKVPAEPELPISDATHRTSASILVVDDNEAVAGILKSMLSDLGYDPDVHLDSEQALNSFALGDRHYDVLLTDLTMPKMSGIELARKIREHSPALPVFIISGYGGEQFSDQISDMDHCHVVSKPITKSDLAKALYKELH